MVRAKRWTAGTYIHKKKKKKMKKKNKLFSAKVGGIVTQHSDKGKGTYFVLSATHIVWFQT